jgi:hypothetical protein
MWYVYPHDTSSYAFVQSAPVELCGHACHGALCLMTYIRVSMRARHVCMEMALDPAFADKGGNVNRAQLCGGRPRRGRRRRAQCAEGSRMRQLLPGAGRTLVTSLETAGQ